MPANHSQTGRAAIHLVDLLNVLDLADALRSFSEITVLILERFFFVFALNQLLFAVELGLVRAAGFGRKKFLTEVERNAGFSFRLINSKPFG